LLHGRLAEAWRDNALLVLALPLGAGLAVRFFVRGGGRAGGFFPAAGLWIGLGGAVVFAVVRNLPLGAGLAP
jgi:hypothetical protein